MLRHVYRACRERVDRYASTLETAVAQRTEELARSNRELEDFASIVAHDLRSPLLTISGYCQLLQEEYGNRLDTEANEYLSHVIGGAARMNRLIEDLLNYSRLGHPKDHLRQVSLESVLAQVSANLESTIRENKAEIRHDPLPTVTGNQTQLVQLFQNLLDNAIKFRSEMEPLVHVGATQNDVHWKFTIKDNGIGIKPEHFEQLFQVFNRLHGREYPGTGIGLAVCKKIVERHGGRIWVESEPSSGTTFSFTLASGEVV